MKFAYMLALVFMLPISAIAQDNIGFGTAYDPDAQVEVAADTLRVNEETRRAILEGNVEISQDILNLSAAFVELDYIQENGTQKINKMIADGGVVITSGEDIAQGDQAIYDLNLGTIELRGDVIIQQNNTQMIGERLVINLNTGSGTISGRVRTTFGGERN